MDEFIQFVVWGLNGVCVVFTVASLIDWVVEKFK